MPTYGNAQVAGFWDAITSALADTVDACGWIVPALLTTVLMFVAIAFVCWITEDLPFDLPIIRAVRGIFRWSRETWQRRPTL